MIENLTTVVIDALVESKTNPRKTFDRAQEKELVESIKAKGIITPLLVRQSPVTAGTFEIVDGARRFRAAQAAGLKEVPVIEKLLTDEKAFEVQLISFTQHADIHPLDEAAAYEQLRKKKFDIAQISAKVGKERSYIARRLQLVNLIESGVKMMREEKLSLPHALEIARLGSEQQKRALDRFRYCAPSLKDLRKDIQQDILLNLDSVQFKKDDATLLPKAGPCTSCPKRTGSNQDLFGDISEKGNHCLDTHCFHLKIQAFNDRRKEELKAKSIDVVEISRSYYPDNKKTLGFNDYTEVPASKANAYGRFVDGDRENVIVPIVIKGKKAKDGSASSGPERHLSKVEMQQRYKRRLEIWQNKIEQQARNVLFDKLIASVKWPWHRKELELVAPLFFKRAGQALKAFEVEQIMKAIGVAPPKSMTRYNYDFEGFMKKLVPKLTDQQLAHIPLACALYDGIIQDPAFTPDDGKSFDALLTVHKNVPEAKIRKDAETALLPKKPKPPKVEAAAKPKAKKD